MDTSVVFDVVCQTYIDYTTEVFISVLRSPLHASGSLPSSAGGFIAVSLKKDTKRSAKHFSFASYIVSFMQSLAVQSLFLLLYLYTLLKTVKAFTKN